jgi:secreted PhoX family phosphatase
VGTAGAATVAKAYDSLAGGGTTTLVINPKTREIIKDFISLSGTLINCAGGPTPWNSWISCEETVLGTRKFKNTSGQDQGGFGKSHGYCFEVPAAADGPVTPIPLKAMGRFVHEAAGVDPRTGIVYLTEDRSDSGFYRFVPKKYGQLAAGGRLQMLAVKGQPNFDTRSGQKEGIALPAAWVDIPDPDPIESENDNRAVYEQGAAGGAATFRRLEGCLFGSGKIFFTSTSGGDRRLGQVWQYTPGRGRDDDGTLTLLFEPTDAAVLNMPDNLCQTRSGNLVICEDNGTSVHLQLLSRTGQVSSIAKNLIAGFETREFAGVTFSPDGQTLFVNVQVPGLTFAIWGPWDRI